LLRPASKRCNAKTVQAVLAKTETTEKERRLPKTDNLHPNPLPRLITKTIFSQ